MPSFTNTFTDGPVGSDQANGLDTYIRTDTKAALKERYALEHYALDSATSGATDSSSAFAQGRHIPGKVGVVGVGNSATMNALTGMGNGALFMNTETGYFYYYLAGWNVVPFGYTSFIASDAQAAAGTATNVAISPKQLSTYGELEYVDITSHNSVNITQTINDTFTYPISGFVGSGLFPAQIREILIRSRIFNYSYSDWPNVRDSGNGLYASFGDAVTLHPVNVVASYGYCMSDLVVRVPVNKGQINLLIQQIFRFSGSFTIIGAMQRSIA